MRVTFSNPATLSRLSARVTGLPNKVLDALERVMGEEMSVLGDLVRRNLSLNYRSSSLTSLVEEKVVRNPKSVRGTVEINTSTHRLLPLMEQGGRTAPHLIARSPSPLAFFWQREGRMFLGRDTQVHHPGSTYKGYHSLDNALAERRGAIIEAFRVATSAVVREELAQAAE